MISIRRIAVAFAVLSASYWEGIAWLWGMVNPLAGIDDLPFWMAVLLNFVPAALYAVVALVFCHWLASRVVKQIRKRAES